MSLEERPIPDAQLSPRIEGSEWVDVTRPAPERRDDMHRHASNSEEERRALRTWHSPELTRRSAP